MLIRALVFVPSRAVEGSIVLLKLKCMIQLASRLIAHTLVLLTDTTTSADTVTTTDRIIAMANVAVNASVCVR